MNKKFWNSYWPGLLWTIAIFILLILPGSSFPKNNWFGKIYLDKWIHIFLFGFFVISWWFAFRNQTIIQQKKIVFKLLLTGILFGLVMEVVQHYWVKSRSFEIKDIMADAFGCFAGWLVIKRRLKAGAKEKPL
jgi:VanZ family protein